MARPGRRDQLVATALELFSAQGIRATGIDTILSRAGVAKMTLYKHFGSKSELVEETLRLAQSRWAKWFSDAVYRLSGPTARERLVGVFDALKEWFESPDFAGCIFIRGATEFPELADPVHKVALNAKESVRAFVLGLSRQAGARDPEGLASGLCLLIEGAIVLAQLHRSAHPAVEAKRAAEILLEAQLGRTGRELG